MKWSLNFEVVSADIGNSYGAAYVSVSYGGAKFKTKALKTRGNVLKCNETTHFQFVKDCPMVLKVKNRKALGKETLATIPMNLCLIGHNRQPEFLVAYTETHPDITINYRCWMSEADGSNSWLNRSKFVRSISGSIKSQQDLSLDFLPTLPKVVSPIPLISKRTSSTTQNKQERVYSYISVKTLKSNTSNNEPDDNLSVSEIDLPEIITTSSFDQLDEAMSLSVLDNPLNLVSTLSRSQLTVIKNTQLRRSVTGPQTSIEIENALHQRQLSNTSTSPKFFQKLKLRSSSKRHSIKVQRGESLPDSTSLFRRLTSKKYGLLATSSLSNQSTSKSCKACEAPPHTVNAPLFIIPESNTSHNDDQSYESTLVISGNIPQSNVTIPPSNALDSDLVINDQFSKPIPGPADIVPRVIYTNESLPAMGDNQSQYGIMPSPNELELDTMNKVKTDTGLPALTRDTLEDTSVLKTTLVDNVNEFLLTMRDNQPQDIIMPSLTELELDIMNKVKTEACLPVLTRDTLEDTALPRNSIIAVPPNALLGDASINKELCDSSSNSTSNCLQSIDTSTLNTFSARPDTSIDTVTAKNFSEDQLITSQKVKTSNKKQYFGKIENCHDSIDNDAFNKIMSDEKLERKANRLMKICQESKDDVALNLLGEIQLFLDGKSDEIQQGKLRFRMLQFAWHCREKQKMDTPDNIKGQIADHINNEVCT